jgi:medium-chain acyl-[acyl-carrier-protein] hydrolase
MPFAIFGHSLGALIGFELVRQLRREQRTCPLQLFVAGRVAPQLPKRRPPIHNLPDNEFLSEIQRYNGIPEEVFHHTELMELALALLRADFTIHDTYTYKAERPLDCPITAFGGAQDGEVTQEHLSAWRAQTARAFSLRMLPGDHFFIHSSRDILLQEIAQDLTRFIS